MGKKYKKFLKYIPLVVIVIIAVSVGVIFKRSEGTISIDTILKYTPENMCAAILVLLCFFALKSLSFIVPLAVLYLASGVLFPPFVAILVSACGLWITITIPYLIGFFYGKGAIEHIKNKYPDTKRIDTYQKKNSFFACFITRIVGILPADVLSIYFGACQVSYPVYAAAGVAGSLLSIVTTTLLGNQLKDPFSIEFIIVLVCRIVVVILAFLINYKLSSKENKSKEEKYGEE